jgi:hypothetical protein
VGIYERMGMKKRLPTLVFSANQEKNQQAGHAFKLEGFDIFVSC